MTAPIAPTGYSPLATGQTPPSTGNSTTNNSATNNSTINGGSGSDATNGAGSSSGAGSSTDSGSTSSSSSSSSLLDPQAFLQLLVAQLQYQDPTNPVDTSSFLSQTATLTQVQSMQSMTDAITSLVDSQKSDTSSQSQSISTMADTLTSLLQAEQAQSATSMIGKQVHYTDTSGTDQVGVVGAVTLANGTATLQIGGQQVPLSSVTEVSATDPSATTPPATTPPTTASPTSTSSGGTSDDTGQPAAA